MSTAETRADTVKFLFLCGIVSFIVFGGVWLGLQIAQKMPARFENTLERVIVCEDFTVTRWNNGDMTINVESQ